jgi:Dolichyl-phosphate-mannose-protein mannosyltransferase
MRSRLHPALVFAVIFGVIFPLHGPLLQLPYFWDEAGYYVPAARDLLLTGSLIPHTTVSNAHPPLVLAWLALWWKCVGFAPLVTRSAMLVVAAFSLWGLYRLAERVANTEVAVAATFCTALYPVFFAQSSLAQVDLAAAGMTFWALAAYLEKRTVAAAAWFSLAVLAKETAVVGLAALTGWELVGVVARRGRFAELWQNSEPPAARLRRLWPLLVPFLVLCLWYGFHYWRTGYVFGNPEFFRYNVASTLNPLRFLLALALRLWQVVGYLHLWVLSVGMLLALLSPPLRDEGVRRRGIEIRVQMIFLAIVSAYVVAMGLIGGAELARYMLPAVPLVIVIAVSTLERRLRYWPLAIAVVAAAFVGAWFWNPPYGFSPEDNLAYRDYVVLHQEAERFLEARYPMAHVLTAWPASDELTRPWLGFTTRPMQVVRIEDFSLEQVLSSAEFREHFETALVFSTKYEPPRALFDRLSAWNRLKARFFGFHRDLPPRAAAQILGGRIVFAQQSKGQWAAVIEMQPGQILNAGLRQHGFETVGPVRAGEARGHDAAEKPRAALRDLHQVAGVGLDHEPDFDPRCQVQ